MGRIDTALHRARVGTHGSVGAAVGLGWLSGPRFDRHFIGTTAAIAILSGLIVAAKPGLLLPVLFLDLRLLGYHHVVSTYTRLCFDADSLRWRGWMIYALLPAVCATVTIPSVAVGAGLLATIYLYWQWFHYTRQRYGIAQAYRRAAVADGAAVVENERRGCRSGTRRCGGLRSTSLPSARWPGSHGGWQAAYRFGGRDALPSVTPAMC